LLGLAPPPSTRPQTAPSRPQHEWGCGDFVWPPRTLVPGGRTLAMHAQRPSLRPSRWVPRMLVGTLSRASDEVRQECDHFSEPAQREIVQPEIPRRTLALSRARARLLSHSRSHFHCCRPASHLLARDLIVYIRHDQSWLPSPPVLQRARVPSRPAARPASRPPPPQRPLRAVQATLAPPLSPPPPAAGDAGFG